MPAPKQTKVKFPRAKAAKIIKKVEKHIKPFVDRQMACGSYRRGAQMIGDIDFVVIPKEGVTLPQMLPPNEGINWVGDNKAQVVIDGEKVDFKVTTPEAWGATILYFTGPADFNIKYRWMAKKRGMKLNEYGLFDRKTDAYIAGATEQDIYDALKRPFRDPDQRTGWKRAESFETEVGKKGEVAWRAMNPHDYAIGLAEGYIPMSRTGGDGFHAVTKLPNHIIRTWQGFPLFEIDIEGLEYYQGFMDSVYPGHVVIVEDIPIEKVMPIDSDLGMDQVSSYNLTKKGKKKYVRGAWKGPRVQRPWQDRQKWSDRFEAPYQPDQELSDYNPQGLMTSSVITGDYAVDSLKFGQTTLSAEDIWDNFLPGANFNPHDDPNYPAEDDNLPCDSSFEDGSICKGSARTGPMHWSEGYLGKVTACRDCWDAILKDLEDNFTTSDEIEPHWQTPTGFEDSFQEDYASETFGSENQWIVNNLTMLLTQRARTLSELIDDLGIRGITVESNLVRNSTFVRVGKHVPAVWGLSGQDYSRKHPYNAISPAAGRKQHLKTMFEKLDPRELDWDDDVTWNQPEVEDWSDEVSWDAEEIKPRCPICFGFIPNNANPGAYPGALSRYDNATEICSSCGQAEGMSGLFLGSVDQDKIADMEAIEDPWLRHTYLINLVTEVMPAAFRGE